MRKRCHVLFEWPLKTINFRNSSRKNRSHTLGRHKKEELVYVDYSNENRPVIHQNGISWFLLDKIKVQKVRQKHIMTMKLLYQDPIF